MMSLACRTLVQCRSDDVTVGEAAKVSATAAVDRRVTDDPLLPIRRHKSRHAAVPATGTDDTVTATDVAAVCMEPVPVHWFTERPTYSGSKDHRYEAVRDTMSLSAVSSLSTRRSASMGHLPQQAVASASLYSSNDVTVTSSAPVAATEHVDVTSRDELSRCESREYRTTSLYSEPTRRGRHETRTRHRPSHGSARQTNTRPTVNHQRADNFNSSSSSSSSSSDNYESVDYIDNQSYSQQPSKHHVCILYGLVHMKSIGCIFMANSFSILNRIVLKYVSEL